MAGFRSRRWVRFPHIPAKVKSRKASEDRRPFYFVLKMPKNPQFYSARHHEPSPREGGAKRRGLKYKTDETIVLKNGEVERGVHIVVGCGFTTPLIKAH